MPDISISFLPQSIRKSNKYEQKKRGTERWDSSVPGRGRSVVYVQESKVK
jgi:hypothetical protein